MKFQILSVLFSFVIFSCSGKKEAEGGLVWLTIEEAGKLASEGTEKKFLIDVYTDWCSWCKVMDNKTFTNPELASYLTENFHLVKFNAEQREPVTFKGSTYNWQDMGRNGVNDLAVKLLNGQMGYPSLVYLDPQLNTLRVSAGYKDAEQLIYELKSL